MAKRPQQYNSSITSGWISSGCALLVPNSLPSTGFLNVCFQSSKLRDVLVKFHSQERTTYPFSQGILRKAAYYICWGRLYTKHRWSLINDLYSIRSLRGTGHEALKGVPGVFFVGHAIGKVQLGVMNSMVLPYPSGRLHSRLNFGWSSLHNRPSPESHERNHLQKDQFYSFQNTLSPFTCCGITTPLTKLERKANKAFPCIRMS